MLTVGYSQGRGRGVFATRHIRKGETLEEAPVIVLSPEDAAKLRHTHLYNYFFQWGKSSGEFAVVLGLGSIYNHDSHSNARYIRQFASQCMRFVATRDIQAGEEIFVNYNGDDNPDLPLWFSDRKEAIPTKHK